MPELAYLNGDIMPIGDARVPIEDRGYQFGDAVYEYVASYQGRLFCLAQHMDRLERSMRELDFPPSLRDGVEKGINTLFEAAETARAGIYIQVSRGVAERNHAYSRELSVQTVMTIREVPDAHPHADSGAAVITVQDTRWSRCDIKTVQLIPNALAKQKALDAGVYDAVFVAPDKTVREATSSNLFMVKDGTVVTHPLTPAILPGITRQVIIEICRTAGIPVQERFFIDDELFDADEVILSGTVTEVLPIIEIDGRPVGQGSPGTVTGKLYRGLRKKAGVG